MLYCDIKKESSVDFADIAIDFLAVGGGKSHVTGISRDCNSDSHDVVCGWCIQEEVCWMDVDKERAVWQLYFLQDCVWVSQR